MRVRGAFIAPTAILAALSRAQISNGTDGPSSTGSVSVEASMTSFPTVTSTGDPCAIVSTLVSSFEAIPSNSGKSAYVHPSLALACLDAVPLDAAKSSAFIDYLNPFLQFQATLAYLKNPPIGYTLPGVDIIGGLDQIKNNIHNGKYQSQWTFEKDVNALVNFMPKDFHLTLGPSCPLSLVFAFYTSLHLVSVSTDGLKLPQVYSKSDLDTMYKAKVAGTMLNWTASPIISIDNTPVSDYLQVISLYNDYQDPDALYNQLFYSPAQALQKAGDGYNTYLNPFGLNDTSSFIFSNDTSTSKSFPNFAYIPGNFTNINSGSDLFSQSVLPQATSTTAVPTSQAAIRERALPTSNPYPTNPIAQHPQGYISGYFLDGYDDTCILQMSAFEGSNQTDSNDAAEIQETVRSTLAQCTAADKTKLIIDLSANGGGLVFNGYDTFKQLFPKLDPFGGTRVRATPAVHFFVELFSEAGVYNGNQSTVYQTQANVDVNGNDFSGPEAMFGPYQYYNDNFSAELRYNLSDPTQHNTINITGYDDLSNPPQQPFDPENIIMVMDGLCGSTCSVFAELMKTIGGVRSVAVGGRPQNGPMQYVGGSKGAQVYSYSFIQELIGYVPLLNESFASQDKQLPALPPDEWIPSIANPPLGPALGSQQPNFNLRNAYKPNDTTQTPLQFLYEAANCRLFYTYEDLIRADNLWQRVYRTVWGNSTCVPGSTISSSNTIPAYANDTVPFNSQVVSNATNPFTGPGSLGSSSNVTATGTPVPTVSASATSSVPISAKTNGSTGLKANGVMLSVVVGLLLVLL